MIYLSVFQHVVLIEHSKQHVAPYCYRLLLTSPLAFVVAFVCPQSYRRRLGLSALAACRGSKDALAASRRILAGTVSRATVCGEPTPSRTCLVPSRLPKQGSAFTCRSRRMLTRLLTAACARMHQSIRAANRRVCERPTASPHVLDDISRAEERKQ